MKTNNHVSLPAGRSLLLCAFASLALCVFSAGAASSPFLIPYQGRLTDPGGVPYTNGQYTLAFNLYDQPVGGANLWSETHYRVGVINGMVNVFLGSINPGLTNVDFSQSRHLGITIYADNNPNNPAPEMVPRQMIIPAFWAKNSENSMRLAGYDWTPLFGANNPNNPLPGTKIQNYSITAAQIASNTITAVQIANGSIGSAQLAGSIITSNQIVDGSISSADLAPGSVGTLQLATNAVTQANLAPRQTGTNVGPGGVAMSLPLASTLVFSNSVMTDLPNLTVTISTTGRPVFVGLVGSRPGTTYSGFHLVSLPLTPRGGGLSIDFLRETEQVLLLGVGLGTVTDTYPDIWISPSSFHTIDTPPAGTWHYKVRWATSAQQAWAYDMRLIAYEL